jgi:hypothetical protein
MIKGRLQRGDAMFVVRIEHYVTLRTFVTALTENYYGKNESFPWLCLVAENTRPNLN